MKAWTSATCDGTCSYDRSHGWKTGARIFHVQGVGGWKYDYCATCAVSRQEAPPDTGEILDFTDAPSYPAPMRALAESLAMKVLLFDSKAAAANDVKCQE